MDELFKEGAPRFAVGERVRIKAGVEQGQIGTVVKQNELNPSIYHVAMDHLDATLVYTDSELDHAENPFRAANESI